MLFRRFAVVELKKQANLQKRFLGGHGGPAPPPFVRLPAPNKPLPEEYDLIWNDGVAPEAALDFDAPEVSSSKALAMWISALGSVALLYAFVALVRDPPSLKPTVKRELDVEEALGGRKYRGIRS